MRWKMKNHSILTLAIIALLVCTAAEAKYSGGTGEPNDPYQIATAEDLNDIGNHEEDWDKHFILVNDVNLAQYTGTQFKIIGTDYYTPFTGVFYGNDNIISNADINKPGSDSLGFFGCVGSGGQIRNLGVENININGRTFVGGLVGLNNGGTLTSCYTTGSVSGGAYVGGLVGYNWSGTLTSCYATGSVTARTSLNVGGLVGCNYSGTLTSCYATGSVSGIDEVGGLVGYNWDTLTGCYATGSVSGTGNNVGGLAGLNIGTLTFCYAAGSVSGTGYVGGLAGQNQSGTLTSCYAAGSVTGTDSVGGLVGANNGVSVSSSFWDTQTSGQMTSAGGEGKTTAEMKTLSTFTSEGWDFVEIWGIEDNQTYPFLKLTYPVGDLNYDKKVDFEDFAILALHWLEGTGT